MGHGTIFKQTMDSLNFFMKDKDLPNPLRIQLREYFNQTKHLMRAKTYGVLMDGMSMELRGKVAYELADQDLVHVWYLREEFGCCRNFLTAISLSMNVSLFASKELVSSDCLRIIVRGLAGKEGRVLQPPQVWGEDCIVTYNALRNLQPVVALTYLEVMSIEGEDLLAIAAFYPTERELLRKAAIKMAFRGAVRLCMKMKDVKRARSTQHLDLAAVFNRSLTQEEISQLAGLVKLEEAVEERKHSEIVAISKGVSSVRGSQESMEEKVATLTSSVAIMEEKIGETNNLLETLLEAIKGK